MTITTAPGADALVRQSVIVKTSVERAFHVFTAEIDNWWPRSHHIGKSPMKKNNIEPFVGGRCYAEQEDGSDCPWGLVTVWEPPTRFVFAWQVTHEWGFEPDLSKASEVEIRFSPHADGSTRIDLEHRHFERHGVGAAILKTAVAAPDGWAGLLALYAARANQAS